MNNTTTLNMTDNVTPSIRMINRHGKLNARVGKKRKKPTGYRRILRWEDDAKTVKGQKQGHLTGIMYLAPADTSGVINVCVKASKGCKKSCLFESGHALVWKSVNTARIAKTRFMVENPEAFKASLVYDIESLWLEALSRGLTPCVRINGTSDIPKLAHDMALRFRDVQFYDYTKLGKAWRRTMANYHLTFSHSEDNHEECMEALRHGINVAVVFGIKKGVAFPAYWHGYRVINGDESDLRFLDPVGVVVGLYAKGKAKQDDSGFVVRDLVSIQSAA